MVITILTGTPIAQQAAACDAAAIQALAPAGTTITAAKMVEATATVPRHCQVDGHTASPGNTVNFRVGLPDAWNGKFYFVGVGGTGGSIGNLTAGLTRGYASASTDTGHVSSDTAWSSNRAKEIDYGHRGTHVTAVASKALTGKFYGRAPALAYFNGCSNGGRQALMEVQRYPEDFDGIIGGHPATGTPMQVGRALVYQKMLASPANYLTADAIELLSKATLEVCDATDGLTDGLVSDPRACRFDPARLKCSGAAATDCLTAGQIATIQQVYAGAKLPSGQTYVHGFPFGHEGGQSGWRQRIGGVNPPVLQEDGTLQYVDTRPAGYGLMDQNFRSLALDEDDPSFTWRTLAFPRDLPRLKTMTEILTADNPDLRPFRKRAGKLLLYHGWADPGITAYGTVDYFDRVVKTVGGQRAADQFLRLYLVPGMHHCSGGPGPNTFDMLTVLENWIEKGVEPGAVIASRTVDGKVTRTRPLCPHPQVAKYNGSGSVDEASSFTCK